MAPLSIKMSNRRKLAQLLVILVCSFLVYTLAGYNYFLGDEARRWVKLLTPIVTYLLYRLARKYETDQLSNVLYGFFSISVGFLLARYTFWFRQFIPGVVQNSLLGWSISKLEEAIPMTLSVILLGRRNGETLRSLYLTGGKIGRNLLLGVAASSLSAVQYVVMNGASFSFIQLMMWIPWLAIFSVSNSLMEELMFRGLFLRKYEELFGEYQSNLLISAVFSLSHAALLPFMGVQMLIIFIVFLFIQAYVWGYITQKTGSLWGAVLAHAVADILFVYTVFRQ